MVYDPDTAGPALTVASWLLSKDHDEHDQAVELIRSLDETGAVLSFVSRFMSGGTEHRDCLIRVFSLYGEQASSHHFGGWPRTWREQRERAKVARIIRHQTGIPVTAADLVDHSRPISASSSHGKARRERLAHPLAAWLALNMEGFGDTEPWPGDDPRQVQLFGGAK